MYNLDIQIQDLDVHIQDLEIQIQYLEFKIWDVDVQIHIGHLIWMYKSGPNLGFGHPNPRSRIRIKQTDIQIKDCDVQNHNMDF